MPSNVHNLTLSADAKRMWSTLPLQAADLTDPRNPRFLGNLEDELRTAGEGRPLLAHQAWPPPDGPRLHAGAQMVGPQQRSVIDGEDWAQTSPPTLVRQQPHAHPYQLAPNPHTTP